MSRLTKTDAAALATLSLRRPVAGNDDGWVDTWAVSWQALQSLKKLGLVEPMSTDPSAGRPPFRITEAGRLALHEARAGERDDG